ncbi:MAG: sigma-70 family RNA polymerase sigma factor [Proteobacteria bacterium]|nr:sigma-70 family RNA polymerase sigma factor [Pseudomonadota bacterium]
MHAQVEDVLACVPNLERYARRLSHGEESVEDLVQETVARALGNLERYRPTGDLKAWLFTIMKNHVRDLWRKRRNMATVSLAQATEIESRAAAPPQIDHLFLRDLTAAIRRLPDYQRDVLLQVSMDPSSYQAASIALGIPISTVRSRLFRARNSLHRLLDDDGRDGAGRRRRSARLN